MGAHSPEVLRRFKTERQILATLEHPNIARLLDGGSMDSDLPYVVMEYVEGVPIDEYCRNHDLDLREKLTLFARVCEAVQYAHRNLIVHRDLKPSNILVTSNGDVKLLDFGIGKLLDTRAVLHTVPMTRAADRLMTPEYASPEQVRGEPVSTATDIYSLGVVLYELLAGNRPFVFETATLSEAERIVCEREPAPPGVDRDLDNIILMAMRKEPERRYATVAQLAEDLTRWRENLPVTARPNTWRYRARKFTRRNRWLVAGAAALAVLLAGFGVAMAMLARSAQREADNSRAVADFLVSVFENAAPAQARGRTVTARELLDTGAKRVREELQGRPVVQGSLLSAIGNIYLDLGQYDTAGPLLQDAVRILREHRGDNNLDTATSLMALAGWHSERGEFAQSEALHRQVLAIRQRLQGEGDPAVAAVWSNLGMTLFRLGRFAEAEQAHRNAVDIKRRRLSADDPSIYTSLNNLAITLFRQGKYAEAEPIMRGNVDFRVRRHGERHPSTATSLHNYSFVLGNLGRYAEQQKVAARALAIRIAVLGENHPDTAYSWSSMSAANQRLGNIDEAVANARKVLAIRQERLKPGSVEIGLAQQGLAAALLERGDIEEAANLIQQSAEALAGRTEALPGSVDEQRGMLHWARGDYTAADRYLQEAIAAKRKAGAEARHGIPNLLSMRADLLRAAGRLTEGQEAAQQAVQAATEVFPAAHPERALAVASAGSAFCDIRRLEEAATALKAYLPSEGRPIRTIQAEIARCRKQPQDVIARVAGKYANHWRLRLSAGALSKP
jgi:serine/threonine-protein kinase